MKTISILALMIMLTACGKGGGGGGADGSTTTSTEPVIEGLTYEQDVLVTRLLFYKQFKQKEVIERLLELPQVNNNVLKKIESHINIECMNDLCQITSN